MSRRDDWHRAWDRAAGSKAVLGGSLQWDKIADYLGYKVVFCAYSWRYFLKSAGVSTSETVADLKSSVQARIPSSDLQEAEATHLEWAKAVVRRVMKVTSQVVIVETFTGDGAGSGDTIGMYDRETEKIFLARVILSDRRQTLHTLLHEVVHQVSRRGDLTAAFETALLDVAVDMIMAEGEA